LKRKREEKGTIKGKPPFGGKGKGGGGPSSRLKGRKKRKKKRNEGKGKLHIFTKKKREEFFPRRKKDIRKREQPIAEGMEKSQTRGGKGGSVQRRAFSLPSKRGGKGRAPFFLREKKRGKPEKKSAMK